MRRRRVGGTRRLGRRAGAGADEGAAAARAAPTAPPRSGGSSVPAAACARACVRRRLDDRLGRRGLRFFDERPDSIGASAEPAPRACRASGAGGRRGRRARAAPHASHGSQVHELHGLMDVGRRARRARARSRARRPRASRRGADRLDDLDQARTHDRAGGLRRFRRLAAGLAGGRLATGVSAKRAPAAATRCCACVRGARRIAVPRSLRIELDALFTSMPVSCLSRVIASGLDMPSSSATL